VAQDYYTDVTGKAPRYDQLNAINAVVEAVARGKDRILLVMATGTGKTYIAFQIIWRLWKAGVKKRFLFLADRNIPVHFPRPLPPPDRCILVVSLHASVSTRSFAHAR